MTSAIHGERGVSASVCKRNGSLRTPLAALAMGLCFLTTACQQEMARQPSYRPLEHTEFYADGRASRSLVEGSEPWRGGERGTASVTTYRRDSDYADVVRAVAVVGTPGINVLAPLLTLSRVEDFVDVCPIAIDRKALERGKERFNIYCSVCHDTLGTGNGKIVERGYLRPPNYHTDYSRGFERRGLKVLLREAPIGYFYDVITRGYGGMPDYSSQIPPDDRWKIVAYIRVLQRSQLVPLKNLPVNEREKFRAELRPVEEKK